MLDLTEAKRRLLRLRVILPSGCWELPGSRTTRGYAIIFVHNVRYRAHRLSFMVYKGLIPDGYMVCHSCDNPACFNPDHLKSGTAADNRQDMAEHGTLHRLGRRYGREAA